MPATEEVVEQGKESTAGAGKGQAETVTIPKAEWERNQRELNERGEAARYWSDRARAGNKGSDQEDDDNQENTPEVPEVTGNEDVDQAIFSDPEKWVAAIAKGPAAIEALIRKGGYVTAEKAAAIARKVARETVNETTGRLSSDHAFMNRYPDLQNKESDLFKATATEYNEMLAEMTPEERREAKKSPLTLRAAARTAEAKLKAAKTSKPKADEDDFEYERVDPEEERRQRVRAQDGSRGGRGGGGEEESRIGPQQRAVLEGMGVSEDKFRISEKNIGSARRRK